MIKQQESLDNATLPESLTDEKKQLRFLYNCIIISTNFLISHLCYWYITPEKTFNHALAALLATIVICIPIFIETINHFKEKIFGMNELVLIAILACCANNQYMEAAIIGLIMTIHEVIENWTPSGATSSLQNALKLNVREVLKKNGEEWQKTKVQDIHKEDLVKFLPGDTFVVDGLVTKGQSTVNKSSITGEALPVEIQKGSEVLAGTININGVVELKVTASIENTVISHLDKIMSEARESKSKTLVLMDEFSAPYALCVIALSCIVYYFTSDSDQAISLLIVSFPDALFMAAPLAMLAALTSCARTGILIKSPKSLINVKDCKTVLFDKTGTLTEGNLRVKTEYFEPQFNDVFAKYCASLASLSNHPVSRGISLYYSHIPLMEVKEFKEEHGLGISGVIENRTVHIGRYKWIQEIDKNLSINISSDMSMSVVAIDGKFAGILKLADHIRPESQDVLTNLKNELSIKIKLLSGDLNSHVKKLADSLGINFKSECLPQDKVDEILEEKKKSKVLFVGDGLNDAPAMAGADVGVSMKGESNELTTGNADIILLRNNLKCIPYLLKLAKKTDLIIKQNIICGILFVLVGAFLAGVGILTPAFAAIFHLFDAIFIVLNSARLIKMDL